jgi:glycosidase
VLVLCRDLISLRRSTPDLREGAYLSLPSPQNMWVWQRGHHATVAVNFSNTEAVVGTQDIRGRIAIATDRNRDNEVVAGSLRLGPWQGAVVLNSSTRAQP